MSFRRLFWFEKGALKQLYVDLTDIKPEYEARGDALVLLAIVLLPALGFAIGWPAGMLAVLISKGALASLISKRFFRPSDGGTDWGAIERSISESEHDEIR